MSTVHTRIEPARGCGYRKPGGLYLVSGRMSAPCGKLPIPLTVCPCCNAGIKPTRGFQWVSAALVEGTRCLGILSRNGACSGCVPFDGSVTRFGLLWIGEAYYKTPFDFTHEANLQGISRRIAAVPKDLVVGETWVLLAHRSAIAEPGPDDKDQFTAAIFTAFLPQAIEYVVKGDESEEELLAMEKRGLTLVKVHKAELQGVTGSVEGEDDEA